MASVHSSYYLSLSIRIIQAKTHYDKYSKKNKIRMQSITVSVCGRFEFKHIIAYRRISIFINFQRSFCNRILSQSYSPQGIAPLIFFRTPSIYFYSRRFHYNILFSLNCGINHNSGYHHLSAVSFMTLEIMDFHFSLSLAFCSNSQVLHLPPVTNSISFTFVFFILCLPQILLLNY